MLVLGSTAAAAVLQLFELRLCLLQTDSKNTNRFLPFALRK